MMAELYKSIKDWKRHIHTIVTHYEMLPLLKQNLYDNEDESEWQESYYPSLKPSTNSAKTPATWLVALTKVAFSGAVSFWTSKGCCDGKSWSSCAKMSSNSAFSWESFIDDDWTRVLGVGWSFRLKSCRLKSVVKRGTLTTLLVQPSLRCMRGVQ